jgi:hypothetical protein
MAEVKVTTELLTDIVAYTKKIASVAEKDGQVKAAAMAEAKVALGSLKKAGLCDPSATDEQLLAKLADHSEALKTLDRLAKMVPASTMGLSEATKSASVQTGSTEKESDRVFLERLGL